MAFIRQVRSRALAALMAIIAAMPLLSPRAAIAGSACVSDQSCKGCHRLGRAYANLGTGICAVCLLFCHPVSTAHEVAQDAPLIPSKGDLSISKRTIKVSVPDDIIVDMAATNPDAAQMLAFLDLRSRDEDDFVTAKGHAGSSFLIDEGLVVKALPAMRAGERLPSHTSLPASSVRSVETDLSFITWTLEDASSESPRLVLTHRIVSSEGAEIAQLHPDVVVNLSKPTRGKSGMIAAQATSWSIR